MTLEEIENDIYNYYRSMQARIVAQLGIPAGYYVRIQEVGYLARLWAAFDRLVEKDKALNE